jgi:hypothetical protein
MEVRVNTNRLLEMANDGVISWRDIAEMSLNYLSEDDVTEMLKANDILFEEDCDEEL